MIAELSAVHRHSNLQASDTHLSNKIRNQKIVDMLIDRLCFHARMKYKLYFMV